MSRRPALAALAAVAVLAMGAVSCGGGDDAAERTSGPLTSTTTAPAAGETTTPAPAPAPGPAGTPTSRAPATATRATTRPGPATTAARGGGPAAAAPVFTAPGRYRYAASGAFSPKSATGAAAPAPPSQGESVLTVSPPAGGEQRSVRDGLGRRSEQVVRVQADGTYLVSLKFTEQGLTKEFRPPAPVMLLPAGARPGRTWAWSARSTDGQTTVDARFSALREESATVGGTAVPVLVVEAALTTAGDISSTGKQTAWIAVSRALVVRQEEVTDGRYGTFGFHSEWQYQLGALAPTPV